MYVQSLSIAVNSEALGTTLFLLILGVFFASAYTVFIKKYRGEFVISLIESQAFDETTAKSLSELGLKNNPLRKFFIETGFSFMPDYYVVEGDEKRFYVKEESVLKLESKYSSSGITFIQLFITIIAFLAVALVLATAVPDILNMFNF